MTERPTPAEQLASYAEHVLALEVQVIDASGERLFVLFHRGERVASIREEWPWWWINSPSE